MTKRKFLIAAAVEAGIDYLFEQDVPANGIDVIVLFGSTAVSDVTVEELREAIENNDRAEAFKLRYLPPIGELPTT